MANQRIKTKCAEELKKIPLSEYRSKLKFHDWLAGAHHEMIRRLREIHDPDCKIWNSFAPPKFRKTEKT